MNIGVTSGMDLAGIRTVARQIGEQAAALRDVVGRVDGRVMSSTWAGGDADEFRGSAWPSGRQSLFLAAEALEAMARTLQSQADAQERVSAGPGAPVPGVGVVTQGSSRPAPGLDRWDLLDALAHGVHTTAGLPPFKFLDGVADSVEAVNRLPDAVVAYTTMLAGAITPLARRLFEDPKLDLRDNPVSRWLQSPGPAQDVARRAADVLKPVAKVVGPLGIVDEAAQAYQAERAGDRGTAIVHGIDTAAEVLKVIPSPWTYGAGVVIDFGTDVTQTIRGKEGGLSWKVWELL